MNTKTGVKRLRTGSGHLTTTDIEKSEVLNSILRSMCTAEALLHDSSDETSCASTAVCDVEVTSDLVRKLQPRQLDIRAVQGARINYQRQAHRAPAGRGASR